jgi:hypothetical protein
VPLSYALGLRKLGFDVYLVEQMGAAAPSGSAFFAAVAHDFGFENRSSLIADCGAASGLEASELQELAGAAELLVNISGNAKLDWLVRGPRVSVYIDTDPGFTQIWNRDGLLHPTLQAHTHHFSVGTNLGTGSSLVPDDGIRWRPLPPPVVLDCWPLVEHSPADLLFTTVATWRCPSGAVSLDGTTDLPTKLHVFRRMLALPALVDGAAFEIALDIEPADHADRDRLIAAGWGLADPGEVAASPQSFRSYVGGSAAEFSTVQGVYSAANTGWISDRSVRYRAAGRPVLVQDTGVSTDISGGEGMLAFTTLDEARLQAGRIVADYATHAAAARQIAEAHFDSDRVLGEMLEQVGARP